MMMMMIIVIIIQDFLHGNSHLQNIGKNAIFCRNKFIENCALLGTYATSGGNFYP